MALQAEQEVRNRRYMLNSIKNSEIFFDGPWPSSVCFTKKAGSLRSKNLDLLLITLIIKIIFLADSKKPREARLLP